MLGVPTTVSELREKIRSERARLERTVAAVPEQELGADRIECYDGSRWSVKDILAHIAAWEHRMADRLEAHRERRAPTNPPVSGEAAIRELNERIFAEYRGRSIEDVRTDFQASHERAMAALAPIHDNELAGPCRYVGAGDWPLIELISSNTYEHYAEHREAIESWLARRA